MENLSAKDILCLRGRRRVGLERRGGERYGGIKPVT